MAYRTPGVYFTETINPQFVSLTGSERVVTIIGQADRSKTVFNTAVVRGNTPDTADDVITSGEITEIIGVGDYPGTYNYTKGLDYTLSSNRRGVDWAPTHQKEPTAGATYYVTYKIAKISTNYVVGTYYSIDQVRVDYGFEMYGGNIGEIPLAAYLAYQNGATVVKIAQVNPTMYETYQTAGVSSADVSIPVASTADFASAGKIKIEEEVIAYTSKDATHFLGCTRAQDNTTAAAHGINTPTFSVLITGVSADDAALRAAYQTSLNLIKEVETDIVVIMSSDQITQEYLKSHIENMSSQLERKERIGIITCNTITDNVTSIANQALSWAYNRMVMVVPSPMLITLTDTMTGASSQVTVPGTYPASAVAGLLCNVNYAVSESITRKDIAGFDDIGRVFLETEMNTMAAAGVTILIRGSVTVRHGITTDPTNANTSEISIVMIKDYVVKQLRHLLDTTYIGGRIVPGTLNSIELSVQTMLKQFIKYQIINDFRNIKATQDTSDPRVVDVTFDFEAVYPLIWIDVTYQLYVS